MKTLMVKGKEVLLDDEDFERVAQHSWYLNPGDRPYHKGRDWQGMMSRFVLNYSGPNDVDHINHNPLDNRKSNLRVVSHSENMFNRKGLQSNNSTGAEGVCETKYGFQAYVHVNGKRKHLGYWPDLESAKTIRKMFENGEIDVQRGKVIVKESGLLIL